ncbi:DUF742 domain-containing protein [Nocardia sp. NBC_00508]|uniref:DUF742 domain-containing protein n=1 Tax=Nocardia sp. NBC_00508 TaxID=2975992 RepID=UPI002E806E88|nr:DUF742 domain-containing protein [Nocardia sp. NBC_00508]WUD66708.1 DUF742 domain-containing protein [Nocardia sp. NBC_00508]
MTHDEDSWFEEDPGPLVRPFAVTRGRAGRDLHNLDIITLVVAIRSADEAATLDREYGEILRICQGRPLTIAEIAAGLHLLLATVKVLVSDLISSGHLIFSSPTPLLDRPDVRLLQAVLDGVRNI